VDLRKAVPLLLAGLALGCAAILVPLSDALPFRLGFVKPATLFTALVEARVFFALLLWPLFLEPALRPAEGLLRLGALHALTAPLVLVAANISDTGAADLARAEFLCAGLAALALGLRSLLGESAGPAYFAGSFVVSALLPFVAFLAHESGGSDLSGLSIVSPFWAAAAPGWGAPVLFGALALGALVAARLLKREGAPA
jgi:hypothetical protein